MPNKPNRQIRKVRLNFNQEFDLFNDDEIFLMTKFYWSEEGNITRIDFELENLSSSNVKYKICNVQRCKNVYPDLNDYVLIQLSTFGRDTFSKYSLTLQSSDEIKLRLNSKQMFLFNVNREPCKTTPYSCELNGPDPETKDGSVIVGG